MELSLIERFNSRTYSLISIYDYTCYKTFSLNFKLYLSNGVHFMSFKNKYDFI
jgi:hypothetical protein